MSLLQESDVIIWLVLEGKNPTQLTYLIYPNRRNVWVSEKIRNLEAQRIMSIDLPLPKSFSKKGVRLYGVWAIERRNMVI